MTEKRSFQDSPVVTRVITFRGTVQGVGFRPTVAALARSLSMVGSVCNMGGSVQLVVTDTPDRIDAFVRAIEDNKPAMSDISRVECRTAETVRFRAFTIKRSYASGVGSVAVPADIAVCGDCLREFYDRDNPRYKHPFISCAVCGPRFTIMERLPYDRDTTSMDDFEMCAFCADAYEDIKDRRFHAQTISCHDCGPMAEWFSVDQPSGAAYTPDESIAEAIDALRRGGVVAVKCVGGYCFACDPFSAAAVRKTRDIKVREEKPFAILFRDADAACLYCAARAEEYELLRSPARPIVLLERLQSETPPGGLFDPGVSGDSRFIGAFLPSMGLQYLLSDALGPLVMTSANLSGLPIIKDDDEMRALVLRDRRVAGMLYNRRRIVMRADDSVARVVDGTPQLIRRSKGYAPTPVTVRGVEALTSDDRIFAAGGQLKAAFSLSRGNLAYMSQYMGDLSDAESENVYRDNFHRMKRFFDAAPDLIVRDMHPLYHTTKFAEGYAENAARARRRSGCGEADCDAPEVLAVQHHHAHAASVMAEHGLDGPIIGVSFDGTGYGSDGKIWGGEILLCEGEGFTRFSHLGYVRMIGGDASMKEGWKSAVSHVMDRKEKGAREPTDADGSATFDIDLSDIIAYGERNRTLAAFERIPQI
ncbi:MAG: carbamoyltransferase HypF, partial [Clostridiales Family XIII bacterium]|nr:carbamoyltransferase HypF [Clostridiales Family XIII bacterium]